ncbi:hypothetical protein HOT48_gp221 [Klebsiella phage ZCKP1]|uniref:Uncharacterized protein n=1 Tax=Klebsiella phage ZCKP1 TaxID=2201417 RepID=A0A2Z4QEV0_9CAUD|nr:hypothetical protein HOT48_gp221 [Klebsiella phage ZCKP1]AWY08236.1 hypothetical protein [Klebsiella phage ZCKP1]
MKTISYLESNNMFFAPVDEIIEALNNEEGINGLSYDQLLQLVATNEKLAYYVENFDEAVIFTK